MAAAVPFNVWANGIAGIIGEDDDGDGV